MIYLDSIGIKFLVNEIKEEILNFKINKIFQYDSNSFSLFFSKKQIFFQIKGNESIVYIKDKKEENTNFSSSFLLSLKKYLDHSEIKDIKILNNDRIIEFTFKRVNISGNLDTTYLIFEIMGIHSNIFLLNDNRKIINILNNKSSIENKRFYSINSDYEIFSSNKKSLEFEYIYNSSDEMIENIVGIGKVFANDTFNNIEKRKTFTQNYKPIIFSKNNQNILTYNRFTKYENYNEEIYESLNSAINSYFTKYVGISIINNLKSEIEKYILNKIKKNNKILLNIQKDIDKDKNFDVYKNKGDLLASNLHVINRYMEKITLKDYTTNEDIEITLNPLKSPIENMNIYYTKYRKLKKAIGIYKERYESISQDNIYLNDTLEFLKIENDYLGLVEIQNELGLNKKINSKNIKEKKRELLKYSIDGYQVLVGRNHSENNFITFEKAKNHDIWLHARDIPGSHVIIIGKDIPKQIIYEAAKLAAKHSKGIGRKIIDYTTRNNVKRTNKIGFVTFNNYKSIEINDV